MSYITKIRNRDGRLADFLYRSYKYARRSGVPPVPGLYHLLAYERRIRGSFKYWMKGKLYDEPLFKLQLAKYGKGLELRGGIPVIMGDLRVELGDDVTMHGSTVMMGAKVFSEPRLVIGDGTHCGSFFSVYVGRDITIGRHVLIANRVSLIAYDGHPVDPVQRLAGGPAGAESSQPIHIGDNAWICTGAFIMKGVTIGEGSIVGANSVVVKNIPPGVVAAGAPARVLRDITAREERALAAARCANQA